MQKILKRRYYLLLIWVAIFSLVLPGRAFAVAGSIYFNPSGGNPTGDVKLGDTFVVEVRGNVPYPALSGGATINVTYPANLLKATSASSSGGALGTGNSGPTIKSGNVNFVVFNFFGRNVNNEMIFKITFVAIATGSATLNFSSNTNINDGPTTKQPTTYLIIPNTCPAGQIGTPPNCTTPPPPAPTPTQTTTPKPSTPAKTTTPKPSTPVQASPTPAPVAVEETPAPTSDSNGGLQITNVNVVATRQENSVSWSLSDDTITPTFTYGTSKTNQNSKSDAVKQGGGSFKANLSNVKPGTIYYFTIKASSESLLQGATYKGTLITKGYPVQLTIQQNGIIAGSAKVVIGDRSFVANKNGIITTELSDGTLEASITPVGSTEAYIVKFTVAKKTIPTNGSPEQQSFILNAQLDSSSSGSSNLSFFLFALGILLLALGIIAAVLFLRRRNQGAQPEQNNDSDLLISSYGPVMSEQVSHTPEPNLSTGLASQPMNTFANPLQSVSDPQISPNEESALGAGDITGGLQTTPSDQSLPLPPNDIPDYGENQLQPSPSEYTEAEQLTPELAQVETEQLDSDEPSAIYDASTGELDIIHHDHHEQPKPNSLTTPQQP